MEDNAYNREIARQLAEITNKYIDHLKRTGKEMRNSSLVPLTGPMTGYGMEGAGFFDSIGDIAKTALPFALMALGKTGGKRKGGEIKTVQDSVLTPSNIQAPAQVVRSGNGEYARGIGGADFSKMGAEMGNLADNLFERFGHMASFALGKEGGKKKRGRPSKKGKGVISSFFPPAALFGLGEEMQGGKRKRGRPRKAGSIGVDLMAETKKNLLTGGQMEAGGWMDDFINMGKAVGSQALNVGKDIGKEILKENIQRGKKALRGAVNKKVSEFLGEEKPRRRRQAKKAGQMEGSGWFDDVLDAGKNWEAMGKMKGSGWFDDVLDAGKNALKTSVEVLPDVVQLAKLVKGKGAKCGGKKTSPWIAHCKAFAKKHKISYRDALKDPRCKSSYKK